MANQYPKLVNKQFNSPINLYSDRNVREILERETMILSNGAVGIDFNNPMMNKPSNLQNSAVLRMLEEEENRKRSGQPGSVKRVAWPPPNDSEFTEQAPVQSQGGPLYSSKTESGAQNNQVPIQQPQSPICQQVPQSPKTFQPISPNYQQAPQSPNFQPATAATYQPGQQSPHQSAPISPNVNKSPLNFPAGAKPWGSPQPLASPQSQFRSVQAPQLGGRQPTVRQIPIQLPSSPQPPSQVNPPSPQAGYQPTVRQIPIDLPSFTQPPSQASPQSPLATVRQIPIQLSTSPQAPTQANPQSPKAGYQPTVRQIPVQLPSSPQPQSPQAGHQPTVRQISVQLPSSPQPQSPQPGYQPTVRQIPIQLPTSPSTQARPSPQFQAAPQSPVVPNKPVQQYQPQSPKIQSGPPQQFSPAQPQPRATPAQGTAQNTVPQQNFARPAPTARPVEPPPSTIILRPQAPVSQAPPPLITSQPATATLRGGKKLRGDLKWPPEEVKEKMEAEKQHLIELSKGPAVKPRKQHKDYSQFFAKHALNSTYPGYKIPPGTQFYDHNPVM